MSTRDLTITLLVVLSILVFSPLLTPMGMGMGAGGLGLPVVLGLVLLLILRHKGLDVERLLFGASSKRPLSIAKERYVRGKITRDQYDQLRWDLEAWGSARCRENDSSDASSGLLTVTTASSEKGHPCLLPHPGPHPAGGRRSGRRRRAGNQSGRCPVRESGRPRRTRTIDRPTALAAAVVCRAESSRFRRQRRARPRRCAAPPPCGIPGCGSCCRRKRVG